MSVPHTVFALITDTHFQIGSEVKDGTLWNRQMMSQSERIADSLVQSLNAREFDFVIHAGDLTHAGDRRSFEFTRAAFSRAKAPLWLTVGNHDVSELGVRSWLGTEWGIEGNLMYFSRYHRGVRYLFLDSNYAHFPSGEESEIQRWDKTGDYSGVGFSAAQIDWLRDELARDRETLTFVITHHPIASKSEYPIISPRDLGAPNKRLGPVWRKLFPVHHKEVLDLLESAPNVKVVFTGHWHINDITRVNNLYHVKTSSLIEYPFEYRVVSVFEKFMDISVVQLPAEDLVVASIVPEWHNEWIRGESFDRERRIYFDDESIATRF